MSEPSSKRRRPNYSRQRPPDVVAAKQYLRRSMQVLLAFIMVYSFNFISVFAVNQYIIYARQKYDFSVEHSLKLLLYHDFDVELARLDLTISSPKQIKWTAVEEAMFDQAYKSYGKDFSKIHDLV